MTQKQTIGDAVLYCGDCRDILPTLGKVDAVVTDPPYLLTSGGNTESHKALGGWLGNNKNDGRPVHCDMEWAEVMDVIFGAMSENSDAYVMANDKNINDAINAGLSAGLKFHNLLVWDKQTAVMNRWYMKNCEFTAYFWKGNAKTINNPSSKQLFTVSNITDGIHPNQKPIELMRLYIENSTADAQTILDPFMGSGTTGVACVKLGRKFIGIELEPKYFDIACKRIEDAYKQPDMFIEPPPKPTQPVLL